MKRGRIFIGLLTIVMVFLMMCVSAGAEDAHHTLTFHSGEDGAFANGDTENVLAYAEPVVSSVVKYKYSHTPNLDDTGVQLSNYGSSLKLVDVVTIPDAMSLHVKIIYGGESASYDWVCMWEGAYPEYTASANYGSSITGKLGGGSHTSSSNVKEYDVNGNSVTFGFISDSGGYGDGYGYYAVISYNVVTSSIIDGSYEEPLPVLDNDIFSHWAVGSVDSGVVFDASGLDKVYEDMDLYAVYRRFNQITFHSGYGGSFENDIDTNVLKYYVQPESEVRYVHTPNLDDSGMRHGAYANNYTETKVLSFPGADYIDVVISYSGGSDCSLCIWNGNHPLYNTTDDYSKANASYDFFNYSSTSDTRGYRCDTNAITIGFKSGTRNVSSGYGYYAVVTAHFPEPSVFDGEYLEPASNSSNYFAGWSLSADNSTGLVNKDSLFQFTENTDLYAIYGSLMHTIVFHSGEDGHFDDDSNDNVVQYVGSVYDTTPQISHTPNVSDSGLQINKYGSDVSYTDVVTIPDAQSLYITLKYAIDVSYYTSSSNNRDGVCLWNGAYSGYTLMNDVNSSVTGRLDGGYVSGNSTLKSYVIDGNSVTFGFHSNSASNWSNYGALNDNQYGYYAVIENGGKIGSGSYKEPIPNENDMKFVEWNTEPDGSGISYGNVASICEDTELYAIYEELTSASGVYRNVNWRVRPSDAMLILGLPDESQTYAYTDSQLSHWPWGQYINSLRIDGHIIGNGSMAYMFYGARFSSVDLSNFDMSLVTDAYDMFYNCDSLISIDLSGKDFSSVQNLGHMFADCGKLSSVDLSDASLPQVVSMNSMFNKCSSMTNLDLSGVVVNTVQDVSYMFNECAKLSYLDISGFDFSNVDSYLFIFTRCSSLTRFKFGDNNPVVCANGEHLHLPNEWAYALEDSDPLVGPYTATQLVDVYDSSNAGYWIKMDLLDRPYAVYDDSTKTLYYLRSVETLDTGSDEVQIVYSLGGTEVSGVVYTVNEFASRANNTWRDAIMSAKHIISLDPMFLSGWSPRDWFSGLTLCEDMDLLKFDVSGLTDCSRLFYNCSSLKELDLSTWDPYLASNMADMFNGCSSLEKLDLQRFSFISVYGSSDTANMFSNCPALMELDIIGCQQDYVIDFTNNQAVNLQRVHVGLFPGAGSYDALPGGVCTWSREDGAYGPYVASRFGYQYGYLSASSSDDIKDRAGWYVRSPGITAIYCPSDYTLYFLKTPDSFQGNGTYGTIRHVGEDRTYTGYLYYLPFETDGIQSTPQWYNHVNGAKYVKFLDEAIPANHSLYYWFYGMQNLYGMDLRKLNMSNVISMERAFANIRAYDDIDLGYMDVSNVLYMPYLFEGSSFTTLDLTGWDVSSVLVSDYTFYRVNGHLIAPDFHWDNLEDSGSLRGSTFTNLPYMFGTGGQSYASVFDIPRWSFGKATNGSGMFYYNYGTINAPDWNLDGVVDLSNAFRGGGNAPACTIDVSGWHSNTVKYVGDMFYNKSMLRSIDVTGWHMPLLEKASYMFFQCSALEEIIGMNSWSSETTDGLIDLYGMFSYCKNLRELDLSNWYISDVQNTTCMFQGCELLQELDLSGVHSSDSVHMNYMFDDCYALSSLKIPYLKNIADTSSSNYMFEGDNVLREITVGSDFTIRSYHSLHTMPKSNLPYKWIDTSGTYGPYTTQELIDSYPEGFAGTWVWESPDVSYFIKFEAPDGSLGDMSMITVPSAYAMYGLPRNKFRRPGASFSYWRDNIRGYTYSDASIISGYNYSPGDVVVLTAVFNKRGGEAVTMQDGEFTLKLRKDEQALFTGLPANTVYQVYEDTPYGWTLIASNDTSGMIVPESKSSATFGNEFNGNKCSLVLSGEKFMNGALAGSGEFQFELLDDDGNVIDTALTQAGGDIVFDALTFTPEDVGREIYYTVREVTPSSDAVAEVTLDGDISYDYHEERIRVVVNYQLEGDGSLYSYTSNLDSEGNKVDVVTSVGPYSMYYHSINMDDDMVRDMDGHRDDGSVYGDYVSGQGYSAIVKSPNATGMHVKVTYTNPRGDDGLFAIWLGEHQEVRSGEWSSACNVDNCLRRFSGADTSTIHTIEFDVPGDSLSLRYISEALANDDVVYTETSNFGYHIEVTVDEVYRYNSRRTDGSLICDYVNNQEYSDVLTIPNAELLHVELQYSAPHGDGAFNVWNGSGAVVQSYDSSDEQNVLLHESFDVDGDTVRFLYKSPALALTDSEYNEYSNYGYHAVVTPVSLSGSSGVAPQVVSTPNVDASGVQNGSYTKGQDYIKIVSIPGATKLNFTFNFNMGSSDRLRLFAGSHPEYPYNTNVSSVATLTGNGNARTYSVDGDTATIIFHADSNSTGGNGYGYYATYTSNKDVSVLVAEAVYDDDGAIFHNASDPGYLTLTKLCTTTSGFVATRDGTFMFEITLYDNAGRAYAGDADISYHADQTALLVGKPLNVYHVGLKHNGEQYGILATDQYNRLQDGDQVVINARSIAGVTYSHNSYTNTEVSSFVVSVDENTEDIYLYYKMPPHNAVVKHVFLTTGGSVIETHDVENVPIYFDDEIVLQPKQYDGYVYVSNDYGLTEESDLRGKLMPDEDVVITLNYKAVRSLTIAQHEGVENRDYTLTLTTNYTGLSTCTLGDLSFVDKVATFSLSENERVTIQVPYNTTVELVSSVGFGYNRLSSNGQVWRDTTNYGSTATSWERSIYLDDTVFELFSEPRKTISITNICLAEDDTQAYSSRATAYGWPGDRIDTLGKTWSSSISYNGTTYYYTHQDPGVDTVVGNEDMTVIQYYGVSRTITVEHIRVSATGSEYKFYTSTYNCGIYGNFSVGITSYSGYKFGSAICSSDDSIVLSGSGPVTGTLKDQNITIQIRYVPQ